MKNKIVILLVLMFGTAYAQAQTDTLLLKKYEDKIGENFKLQEEISRLKNKIESIKKDCDNLQQENNSFQERLKLSENKSNNLNKKLGDLERKNKVFTDSLNNVYKKCDDLKKQIESKTKRNTKLVDENKKLKKSTITKERDGLLKNVTVLKNEIAKLRQEKIEILEQKRQEVIAAKQSGKEDALAEIAAVYNKPFDELIKLSTKASINRDKNLFKDNLKVMAVLTDLETVLDAKQLLSQKYNETQVNVAIEKLSKINRDSQILNDLKTYMDDYDQYYVDALKETIENIIELDKKKTAGEDKVMKKLKYTDINQILSEYTYNYYDYVKSPFLSAIVKEIIDIKRSNPDKDIKGLLNRL